MKLIVDIPDDCLERKSQMGLWRLEKKDLDTISEAIKNGAPLPKGHGNLIERGKVFEALHAPTINKALAIICEMPVVIAADKEDDHE